MIIRNVRIPKYGWNVEIYYAVTSYYTDIIMRRLKGMKCPKKLMGRIYRNLQKQTVDSGFTFSNKDLKHTIMVIGLFSSPAEFLNSFTHETRHLVDDITDRCRLPKSGEEVAYLTGDFNGSVAEDVAMFLCHCDKCKTQIKSKCYDSDLTCNHERGIHRRGHRDDVRQG